MTPEYKASIPMRACKGAWLAFVAMALASYVVGDWLVYFALAWFAFWETYGIITPRPGDTYSERNWAFTAEKPARLGLTLGLVIFFSMTLIRLAWEVVFPEAVEVAKWMKFGGALGFIGAATTWLCIHFVRLGKLG